eukprot:Opistho-2@70532
MAAHDDLKRLFVSIGVNEQKAEETARNEKLASSLKALVDLASATGAVDKPKGLLLYGIATRFPGTAKEAAKKALAAHVAAGKIKSDTQLTSALDYIKGHPTIESLDAEFDKHCGVGVEITADDIKRAVAALIKSREAELKEKRYQFVGTLLSALKVELRWADGKAVKDELDSQVAAILGPRTAEDDAPAKGKAKKDDKKPEATEKAAAAPKATAPAQAGDGEEKTFSGAVLHFHKVGENFKTEGYVVTDKTMELLRRHVEIVKGKVHTRFPPEPNGILHIGHAKAMYLNFMYAKVNGGNCYFRYDDTNPAKEEERFFVGIRQMVDWLGHKPYKVTHTSDYFQELYDLAVRLTMDGHAYICHQSEAEVKENIPSPFRERPVGESLKLLEDMRKGKIDEGKATLRMKHTMEDGKLDPVAYRIKFHPHFKTGDEWCIYPTYDYSHCLIDSIENITHSLCTKEFQNRRMSYYWLCNTLGVYCPVQWEYGRLSINYTVLSKRKIQKLIEIGKVSDWDDPRLHTLMGLRRRGFPADAINNFCEKIGVTMAQVNVDPSLLESCVRDYLNVSASRAMAVLEPLRVVITDIPADKTVSVTVPNIPGDDAKGSHEIKVGRVIFIERGDFKEAPEKGYRRLAPNQIVGLKHAGLVLTLQKINKDASGNVTELEVTSAPLSADNKPKAFVHWVAEPSKHNRAAVAEIRLINTLFLHKNPEDKDQVPEGWLTDLNDKSMVTISNALVDDTVAGAKVGDSFQFERVGYFCVDPDSDVKAGRLVFNRIVELKEDAGKA